MKGNTAQGRIGVWRGIGVAAVFWLVWTGRAGGGDAGPAAAEADAEMVRAENTALQRQVEYLSRALAEARARADSLSALLARRELEGGDSGVFAGEAVTQAPAEGVRLVDVNRGLRMVVLGAGRRQGIAAGMVFSVIQGDRAVARVRVVDVRRAVAGAVMEQREFGKFPERGDRLLLDSSRE